MPDEVIYETQEQRDERLDAESRRFQRGKQRSRNKARTKGVRRELMARADRSCEICRFNFWSSLLVHHIKHVQYGGRASLRNLIVLCPNCHALVHHYSHWRKPHLYPAWKRGIMSCGRTEIEAERILIIASQEAVVDNDGVIISWPDDSGSRPYPYVLIEEKDITPVGENDERSIARSA